MQILCHLLKNLNFPLKAVACIELFYISWAGWQTDSRGWENWRQEDNYKTITVIVLRRVLFKVLSRWVWRGGTEFERYLGRSSNGLNRRDGRE